MKKNHKFIGILIGVLLLLGIIGMFVFTTFKKASNSNEEIIIKDNVSIITNETEKERQPVLVTDDELIYSINPQYSKGEVIVAGIIDSAPAGFIRKVVKTTKVDKQYIVKTEYGVLTDVFEKAHIIKNLVLTENGVVEVDSSNIGQARAAERMNKIDTMPCVGTYDDAYLINTVATTHTSILDNDTDYQFAKEFEYDIADAILLKGEVGFNVWVEVELDINNGEVIFGVLAHNESGGEISLECTSDIEKEIEQELFDKKLPSFQFNIGVVPVVITNELLLDINGKAYIQGQAEMSFGINSKNTSGFQYNSKVNKIEEIKEKNYDSGGLQWGTKAKFSGGDSVGIYLHLISKLYDCTGANIAVGIEGAMKGELIVSSKKSKDGLNYVGSVDLEIAPKLQGSIVVSVPVIDKKLAEQPIFEAKLKPFWEMHWDSGKDWKQVLEAIEEDTYKTTTYRTKYAREQGIEYPTFEFDYPSGWDVTQRENHLIVLDLSSEMVTISNARGVEITYIDFGTTDIDMVGGNGHSYVSASISKVAESKFLPSVPLGTNLDCSSLGNFMVAKSKIDGEMHSDIDDDFTEIIDGSIFYAVIPESYGEDALMNGALGLYEEYSFEYPTHIAFVAMSPDGCFTDKEEREVISILSSFRVSEMRGGSVEENDSICTALQNGDFSEFVGRYRAMGVYEDRYGAGEPISDMFLDKNGVITEGGLCYSPAPYLKIKPTSVTKNEDGSYKCQVRYESEDNQDYFLIYPKGTIGENPYIYNDPFLTETPYIQYMVLEGGVMDIIYYKVEE